MSNALRIDGQKEQLSSNIFVATNDIGDRYANCCWGGCSWLLLWLCGGGGTEQDRRPGQGCQLHVHFLHQWLIVLTISVCADITFKFLAKRVAQFTAKCKPRTGQHTRVSLSPPPFPLLPSCYFCSIADECSQNWCMIPCGRLSASGGREGRPARFIADADLAEIQLVLHCFNGCTTI